MSGAGGETAGNRKWKNTKFPLELSLGFGFFVCCLLLRGLSPVENCTHTFRLNFSLAFVVAVGFALVQAELSM